MGTKIRKSKSIRISAKACENLGFTLGKEVSLGVDFASSTQWNEEKQNTSMIEQDLKILQGNKLILLQILLTNSN